MCLSIYLLMHCRTGFLVGLRNKGWQKVLSASILHFCNFDIVFKMFLSAEADIRIDYFVLQGIYFAFFMQ